jgi:hypothetical protein
MFEPLQRVAVRVEAAAPGRSSTVHRRNTLARRDLVGEATGTAQASRPESACRLGLGVASDSTGASLDETNGGFVASGACAPTAQASGSGTPRPAPAAATPAAAAVAPRPRATLAGGFVIVVGAFDHSLRGRPE